MRFDDLLAFVTKRMRMSHIYQPLLIRALVDAGAAAIQAFWQGALDMGLAQVKLDTVEVEGHRDTAIEVGKYTLLGAGGQVADAGKYLVIWKVEGRSWKLHRDIWNSSQLSPPKSCSENVVPERERVHLAPLPARVGGAVRPPVALPGRGGWREGSRCDGRPSPG